MTYSTYEADLYHIYESGVLGETMFGLIVGLTFSADRKRNWRALAQLETQTKGCYLDYVADKPQLADKSRPSSLLGVIYGFLFSVLPWNTSMKMLSEGTDPFMAVFERLRDHAAEEDLPFFDYVVSHEVAIKRFADAELAGNSAGSLTAVQALLQ